MTKSATGAFWDWSLATYDRPQVSQRLLTLQDSFGLSINIVLWCAWTGARFETCPELVIRKAVDMTEHWRRDVSGALRTCRRVLKSPPPQADTAACNALRQSVKDAELSAERIEQDMLEVLAANNLADPQSNQNDPEAGPARARRNLAQYAALAGCAASPAFSTSLLAELIDLIFAESEPA